MSNPYYPDDMTKADYAYIEGDVDYERWFEQNEEDLIADFFERTGLTIEEDEAGFKAYVERRWRDSGL